MTKRGFFSQLGLVTLFVTIILFVLINLAGFQPFLDISIISLVFFLCLSIGVFYYGIKAAKSDNKNYFIRLIMGFTFCKMMLSMIILFIYYKLVNPTSGHFLAPFFITYFCFTIFETYFLMKLGKMKIN